MSLLMPNRQCQCTEDIVFIVIILKYIFMTQWLRQQVSVGSAPAGTHMSHWWQQEGHLAKIAPMHQ